MNVPGAAVTVLLGVAVVCEAGFFGKQASDQTDPLRKFVTNPLKDYFATATTKLGVMQVDPNMTNWIDKSWQMSVSGGHVEGLPEVQFGQFRCAFNQWLHDQCTLGIGFKHLIFTFDNLRCRVDSGDRSLVGRRVVTYVGVRFDIVLTITPNGKALQFDGLRCHYRNCERLADLDTALSESERYCLREFLMSNVKNIVEQEKNGKSLLKTINQQRGNLKTDTKGFYPVINQQSLEDSGEQETILIKPLTYLIVKESEQLEIKEFQNNLTNWQNEACTMSLDTGWILGLSSVLFDNLFCGLNLKNQTECTVGMHFSRLTFVFYNLTYQVGSDRSGSIPQRNVVTYQGAYFTVVVLLEDSMEFVLDMSCHYINREQHESITSKNKLDTLERLYLEKLLMANVKHLIEKYEHKNRYLKDANDLIQVMMAKENSQFQVFKLPSTREIMPTRLSGLTADQLLLFQARPIVNLFCSDEGPTQLALLTFAKNLTNWPDETWTMSVLKGSIEDLDSVKWDTLRCSYNRLGDEHKCTTAIRFPQLKFKFDSLVYRIDAENVKSIVGQQLVAYEGVHFDIVVSARRGKKSPVFVFDNLYARHRSTDRLAATIPPANLTAAEHFCLLQFLMTNVRDFIEKKHNKDNFLHIFNLMIK